jgi:23S rRNA pseudouridine1911/1915/1917 synthase
VVVQPAPGNRSGTLVEALGVRMPLAPAAGAGRPGIVHRLDKDTSGLMVVAKTDQAYEGLVAAMGGRCRCYLPEWRCSNGIWRLSEDHELSHH